MEAAGSTVEGRNAALFDGGYAIRYDYIDGVLLLS